MKTVLRIAIANNFCAVTPEMQSAQTEACKMLSIEPQNGFKAYRSSRRLYLVAFGKEAFLEADKVNAIYGEENVVIHDYCEYGCIFEIAA